MPNYVFRDGILKQNPIYRVLGRRQANASHQNSFNACVASVLQVSETVLVLEMNTVLMKDLASAGVLMVVSERGGQNGSDLVIVYLLMVIYTIFILISQPSCPVGMGAESSWRRPRPIGIERFHHRRMKVIRSEEL